MKWKRRPLMPNAYVQAGGDDEKAARILGGDGRLGPDLDAQKIDHRQKAS